VPAPAKRFNCVDGASYASNIHAPPARQTFGNRVLAGDFETRPVGTGPIWQGLFSSPAPELEMNLPREDPTPITATWVRDVRPGFHDVPCEEAYLLVVTVLSSLSGNAAGVKSGPEFTIGK